MLEKAGSHYYLVLLCLVLLQKLQDKYFFYMWNEEINEARLVTSWDTSGEDIAEFEQSLKEIFG